MPKPVLLLLLLSLGAASVLRGATPIKVISVDCGKSQSLSSALGDKADELIIEVHGRCQENVIVARNRVTLRGGDPERDIIQSLPGAVTGSTIAVRDARNVRIENLTVSGAEANGISISNSNRLGFFSGPKSVELYNCILTANGEFGLRIVDADVAASKTTISGNGLGGAFIHRSVLACKDCIFRDNPTAGSGSALAIDLGARGNFSSSTLSGEFAVSVSNGSHFISTDSTLSGTKDALVSEGSSVLLTRVQLLGSIEGRSKSSIRLRGVTQTFNPAGNLFAEDSSFRLASIAPASGTPVPIPTTLVGDLVLLGFSNGVVLGDSNVQGRLLCNEGSDVFCYDPSRVAGEIISCRSCLKP